MFFSVYSVKKCWNATCIFFFQLKSFIFPVTKKIHLYRKITKLKNQIFNDNLDESVKLKAHLQNTFIFLCLFPILFDLWMLLYMVLFLCCIRTDVRRFINVWCVFTIQRLLFSASRCSSTADLFLWNGVCL